jgi:alpha-1,3/alpha-1,6-mannosyltransferase
MVKSEGLESNFSNTRRIYILHPDLGLGGAERFIVDLALELRSLDHEVVLFTGSHDPHRCFEETLCADGTHALWILLVGSWIPRSLFGYFHAVLANLRCVYMTMYLLICKERPDIVILDQVSFPILLLRMFTKTKVIFYCHFPDFLLVNQFSRLRSLYRLPLNFLEQVSTGMAHKILVNSHYTLGVFVNAFAFLYRIGVCPEVVYPITVEAEKKLHMSSSLVKTNEGSHKCKGIADYSNRTNFLSVNRFERKKTLELAIFSFAEMKQQINTSKISLIIAGGFDVRILENRVYYSELKREAKRLGVSDNVYFMKSISARLKSHLLHISSCILYTPIYEHFGIVPVEAMSKGKPVIACDNGGPLETVVNGVTGFLCAANYKSFSQAMIRIVNNPSFCEDLGENARIHVSSCFSQDSFVEKIKRIIDETEQYS